LVFCWLKWRNAIGWRNGEACNEMAAGWHKWLSAGWLAAISINNILSILALAAQSGSSAAAMAYLWLSAK